MYPAAQRQCERCVQLARTLGGLRVPLTRALVLSGDIASLLDDLEGANRSYEEAAQLELQNEARQRIENKIHRRKAVHRRRRQGELLRARQPWQDAARHEPGLIWTRHVSARGGEAMPTLSCDHARSARLRYIRSAYPPLHRTRPRNGCPSSDRTGSRRPDHPHRHIARRKRNGAHRSQVARPGREAGPGQHRSRARRQAAAGRSTEAPGNGRS